jgi:hypothetical protein
VARGALRMIEGDAQAQLLEMATYHGERGALCANQFLAQASRHTVTHMLDDAEQARKRAMLACHATQQAVLAAFGVHEERFRAAPQYDFSRPPHPGPLYYERGGLPMRARTFCRVAAQAERALGLSLHRRHRRLRVAWR